MNFRMSLALNKLLSYEDTKGIKRDTSEKKIKILTSKARSVSGIETTVI